MLLIIYMGIFYYSNKHLPVRSTKIFSAYYISAVILNLFDLITLYTVNNMDIVPSAVNTGVHIIYLLAINTTVYLYFIYLRCLIETKLKISVPARVLHTAPYAVTSVLVLILPLDYIQGSYTNYSMGEKVYALYASVILYNFFILYYCIRYWKLLNREKRAAIIVSVPVFFAVSVINITMPEALFSIVYVILSALGLMMSNENNEKYIDKQTGMFNQYALGIVASEYISLKKSVIAVVFAISEAENAQNSIDWKQYITAMEQLQRFCRKELNKQAYRIGDNGFVLLLPSSALSAEKTAEAVVAFAEKNCVSGICITCKTVALSECAGSDNLMSKIVDICMNAISKMAVYDFLTGVFNRNFFEKELARLKNGVEDRFYLIADLNNLKETNDILGHSAGDELLQAVAGLLKRTAGADGEVFRQGGDEFAVLWKGEDIGGFLEVLEKERVKLNSERIIPVSFAIGYGRLSEDDGMEKADRMMYENKAAMKSLKNVLR